MRNGVSYLFWSAFDRFLTCLESPPDKTHHHSFLLHHVSLSSKILLFKCPIYIEHRFQSSNHFFPPPPVLTPPLLPSPQDGIFSGCCVNDQGVATILYTGVQIAGPESTVPVTSVSQLLGAAFSEVQCVATCKDDGTFIKHGPVISAPPAGLDLVGFRDPYVWREDDEWLMLLGSGIKEVGGTALLYRSPDLRQWDFVQPLIVGDHKESGTMWECPLLFKLGKWHVLCVSPDNPANPVLFWVSRPVQSAGSFGLASRPFSCKVDWTEVYSKLTLTSCGAFEVV